MKSKQIAPSHTILTLVTLKFFICIDEISHQGCLLYRVDPECCTSQQ